jgi:hypothetical protein
LLPRAFASAKPNGRLSPRFRARQTGSQISLYLPIQVELDLLVDLDARLPKK